MYTLGVETFLAVVRAQTLSKAAEHLHLAQTTVSQRIKLLEQELGITLIHRGKGIKHIQLTPAGEQFFKLAEQWSFIWQEAKLLQAQGPSLSLVIGSVDSINSFILPPVLKDLINHPNPIRLRVHTSHSIDLYSAVETRQVDVAFVLRDLVHPNVVVTKCFSSPMVVLRIASSAAQEKVFLHPEQLNPDYELYLPFGGREFVAWHEHWWPPHVPSRTKLDSINLLFSLLQNESQWAIVPKILANAAAQRGSYMINHLVSPPPNYTCYKLTHKTPTSITQQALEILDCYFHQHVRCF